jgi:hypothetical protein
MQVFYRRRVEADGRQGKKKCWRDMTRLNSRRRDTARVTYFVSMAVVMQGMAVLRNK